MQEMDISRIKSAAREQGFFRFKQFTARDDRSSMKVGTDALLLGAEVDVSQAGTILEVGTGCGVIALILAQRCPAIIHAIDIDAKSVSQARENIGGSPWPERVIVFHTSLQSYCREHAGQYDLVVCNPPFYARQYRSEDPRKNTSRHDDKLNFRELAENSVSLLKESGSLWVILPASASEAFITEAGRSGLHPASVLEFIPREGKAVNRHVMRFSRSRTAIITRRYLTHRDADGSFSSEFRSFARDYYLDF